MKRIWKTGSVLLFVALAATTLSADPALAAQPAPTDADAFPPRLDSYNDADLGGSLEQMLEKISQAYEREVETAIMGMTSLIEPIMIAVMGLAVGFIVLSILLPIFEMNQLIS